MAADSNGKNADSRARVLDATISQIEKSFGKGAIMRLGVETYPRMEAISSGSLGLDIALGCMGFPRGRIVEVYGPESSGKTTLSLHAIASAQAIGGTAAFIDAEHALDPQYAKKLGIDLDSLLVSQPDTGEQALEICEYLVRSNAVDIVVIDSVAALVPRAEIEGEMGATHVGLQARLMSQALRKLAACIHHSNCVVIFINQIRMKIGVMFGNPETTPGGRALKFYSSVRVDIRRIGSLKSGDDIYGNRTRTKVVKNKVAPPFRSAEFDIIFAKGISKTGEILDMGVDNNILQKSGAWFSYGDMRLGQGRENSRDFLVENPDVAEEVKGKILAALGLAEEQESSKDGD